MEDVTQPSIADMPYEDLVMIATQKADAIVKKEFETSTIYDEEEQIVYYTEEAQKRFNELYDEFYNELYELKQAKVEESYSEEYLKQELFRTIVRIEILLEIENTIISNFTSDVYTRYLSYSYKNGDENFLKVKIQKEIEKLSHFIHLAASKFAKEYTKWTHKFSLDENGKFTKEAQKTYDILFSSKKTKLVKELPENVYKLIFYYDK